MTDHTTRDFILSHRDDDIRRLALQAARHHDVDMRQAVTQIAGWQKARHKLPTWAHTDGIIYPPQLAMEQCSSEFTAVYKEQICQRLLHGLSGNGQQTSLADLTGGFGVDFSYMARAFQNATYIEQQQTLCDIASHNMRLLGLNHIKVIQGDAMEILPHLTQTTVVYADPARRDRNGARTYAISDCTPDILQALPMMLRIARFVILKLSPMLDIQKTIDDLQRRQADTVSEIHIVAKDNECKELLIVLSTSQMPKRVFCVNDHDAHVSDMAQWKEKTPLPVATEHDIQTLRYLYEPHAAIMKAGAFHTLPTHYRLKSLAANSHLFLSDADIDHFPGRKFYVDAISTLNKREVKEKLNGVTHANITTRNFPLTVDQLRKRLHLKDGGTQYIFASTTTACTHLLFVCRKM